MTSNTDLINQALNRYGFFVRVSHPDETAVGFGASHVDDHTTAAIGTTGTPSANYSVTMVPAHSRSDVRAPVRPDHPVDIYLDGALLGRGAWQRDHGDIWPDAWLVPLRTTTELEVVVRTASQPAALPRELALVRDRPSLARD
ncbi:hypothetical protein ACFXQA_03010 [Microbacterium sp. P07]|uniref:hypothetical protein n=1 Tax=Microbacterium sp. P07 TaxID=3366952 RepID=UPI003746665B